MISTKEILEKRFEKAMGGYRQEEVDRFLETIAESYEELQSQNAQLQKKLEVLAEKIEQYREDEDSLRAALIGAQKLGDSVIREAKTKAEYILRDATTKSERMVSNAQKDIEKEQMALVHIQKEVSSFKNRLLTLYKQHLELISSLPEAEVSEELSTPVPQEETSAPQNEPQPEPIEESMVENRVQETVPPSEDKKEEPYRRESKFGPLHFGEGFDDED